MITQDKSGSGLKPRKRLIALVDLAGFAKAFQAHSDLEMAAFLQEYYAACEGRLVEAGGTVIKYMGDSCMAVFPPDAAQRCAEAVIDLGAAVEVLGEKFGVVISLGANLHIAEVVEGDFGVGANRKPDIVGRGVNQTFMLGGGPGIRASEPVYRSLASDQRTPWRKHKPPAIYVLESAGGVYRGLGKGPAANAQRW
jgi:adenylate cyclase